MKYILILFLIINAFMQVSCEKFEEANKEADLESEYEEASVRTNETQVKNGCEISVKPAEPKWYDFMVNFFESDPENISNDFRRSAALGDREAVLCLINKGEDEDLDEALLVAIKYNHPSVVHVLIQSGASTGKHLTQSMKLVMNDVPLYLDNDSTEVTKETRLILRKKLKITELLLEAGSQLSLARARYVLRMIQVKTGRLVSGLTIGDFELASTEEPVREQKDRRRAKVLQVIRQAVY